MPVLVEQDASRAARLTALLPDGAHVVGDPAQLERWLQGRPDEYAVVVGPEVAFRDAVALTDRLRSTHPSAGVVLLRDDLTTEVFSQAMQAGIGSVIGSQDGAALQSAVQRTRTTWEAIHGPSHDVGGTGGRVYTVFSPKGGVGKTTVAVNLAMALAGGGRASTCVVDLDLAFGDVAITLQLIPEHTIAEAVDAEAHLDFALLQRLLTRHPDGLAVLAAPTTPEAKERISSTLVRKVIGTLRRHFDYVVLDTSPGFDDAVLQAFDETDELVMVATLDVPTVKNLKMSLETLDMLDLLKENRHLVINRADDEVGLSIDNVESILHMSVASAIPSDIAVANATNHGKPIVAAKPGHPVSRTMRDLAGRLSGTEPAPVTAEKERRRFLARHRR